MSGVVGPNVDSNDDTKDHLTTGQESSGQSRSVKSGAVGVEKRSPDFTSGKRRSRRTNALKNPRDR